VVVDTKLANLVDNTYKGVVNPRRVGDGTLAAAVRSEIGTGAPTDGRYHITKAEEPLRGLNNWITNPPGGSLALDRTTAIELADDLARALAGQ
jgi:hypothetical protein